MVTKISVRTPFIVQNVMIHRVYHLYCIRRDWFGTRSVIDDNCWTNKQILYTDKSVVIGRKIRCSFNKVSVTNVCQLTLGCVGVVWSLKIRCSVPILKHLSGNMYCIMWLYITQSTGDRLPISNKSKIVGSFCHHRILSPILRHSSQTEMVILCSVSSSLDGPLSRSSNVHLYNCLSDI